MSLFGFIKGQFIDVIEWLDNSNDTLAYRFERHNNEIKQGAKLIVRPGQKAIFVNEGQIADVFGEGTHDLYTRNLPILSTLQAWPYGFNSPFKAEVYFFSTRVFTNLKWGTANPIALRDPDFGVVRARAFGSYSIQITNPEVMLQQLISTDGLFQVDEISDQIRNQIVSAFGIWLGRSGIPVLDLAARYGDLGDQIKQAIQPDLNGFGLRLAQMLIENISLPPEVEAAVDKRSSMGILGNMQQYAQFQAANAVEASAKNPAGGGNPALDFGVGIAMGQNLVNAMQQPQSAPAAPPPMTQWYFSRDGQNFGPFGLDQLLQQGLTPETHVWRAGMANWLPAAQVAEVAGRMVPPPPAPR